MSSTPHSDPRTQMVTHARDFHRRGWMLGTSGNLSARAGGGSDPGDFWITASGRSKGELTPIDFLRLGSEGTVKERFAEGDKPSAETTIHLALYRHFPDAGAVYHVHSLANNLASAQVAPGAELALPPLEMIKGFGVWEHEPSVAIPVLENHLDVPAITADLEARLAGTPLRIPAFLIRHHGITTWAKTPEAARNQIELLEFIFEFMRAESRHPASGVKV